MKVCYLLKGTGISGGVKVVLEHVWLLNKYTDIKATAASPQHYPDWFEKNVSFKRVPDLFSKNFINEYNLIVATYFDQIAPLHGICPERLIHFCQGYEGDYIHLVDGSILGGRSTRELTKTIEKAYSITVPRLTVSSWLSRYLEKKFGGINSTLGQGIDLDIFSPPSSRPDVPKEILIAGDSRLRFKGVTTAMAAAGLIKKKLPDAKIIRVNPTDNFKEEKKWGIIDAYHSALSPIQMAHLYGTCHLLIFVSSREGFGLPVLEAMACGVPVVASDIPPLIELTFNGEAGALVESKPEAIAERALKLLQDNQSWRLMSIRGVIRAMDYKLLRISKKLEFLLKKIAVGDLRGWSHIAK